MWCLCLTRFKNEVMYTEFSQHPKGEMNWWHSDFKDTIGWNPFFDEYFHAPSCVFYIHLVKNQVCNVTKISIHCEMVRQELLNEARWMRLLDFAFRNRQNGNKNCKYIYVVAIVAISLFIMFGVPKKCCNSQNFCLKL